MGGREVLREVMTESKVSQSELSRMSGVRQPSISQFLSGRIESNMVMPFAPPQSPRATV